MGQTASDATHAMSRRAEALLRALVGVHHAEVTFRAAGAIASVRVAAAGLSSGLLIRNIRSALLAGLGVAVDPLQIELVDPERWTPPGREPVPELEGPAAPAPEDDGPDVLAERAGERQIREAHEPDRPDAAIAPRNGAGAGGNGNGAGHVETGNGQAPGKVGAAREGEVRNGDAESRRREPGVSRERARPRPPRADPLLGQAEAKRAAAHERTRPGTFAAAAGSGRERVVVERVDLVRHAGRLRCRVVIAAGATRFSAIADGPDEAGNEIQLAGRVACDALRAGALTGAQFESATIAYLAGRVHVVAALGDWLNGEPMPRSGSAVAGESLEHAAARAVLQAVLA